jgi:uncharacterized phage-associated protein
MSIINLFDKDVTINAVLYIIQQMGGRVDMHKVFKTLFFADQEHLSKYGRTITGDVYIAMNYGPVPSKTDDIFKAVRGDSYFPAGDLKDYFHFTNNYYVENDKKPDLDYLSKSDLMCLDNAIGKCKNLSFDELTNLSHGLAWQNTAKDRVISFSDILREKGDSEEYVNYISNKLNLESSFC